MTEQGPSQYPSAGRPDHTTSGWAVGFMVFAAIMLLMVGIWQALPGLIANFRFIPYYPFWALLIIGVDVFVIWAIAAHGREVGV